MTNFIKFIFLMAASTFCLAADFNESIPVILRHEGKLADYDQDSGGITHFGISLRFVKDLVERRPELLEEFDLDNNSFIDRNDILKLSQKDAVRIYKNHWWKPMRLEKIQDQRIATKLLDIGVNVGSVKAIKIYQETYNVTFGTYNLKITGFLDKETIDWTNCLNEDGILTILEEYNKSLENYYRYLATRHPVYKVFLKGWLNRLYDEN